MADSAEPVRPTSTDRQSAWSPERLTQTASRSLQSLEGYSMRTFKIQGSGTIIYTLKINKDTNITPFIKNESAINVLWI